jgi:Kef-type K+ transport system membrane component KefB
VRYGLWAGVPLLLFVALFFAAVGLEEWLGVALLPEPLSRVTLLIAAFLLGVAGVGSACFGVRCAIIKAGG